MGLILGIDICDDYSQISAINAETNIPELASKTPEDIFLSTVICKKREEDEWLIGQEGFKMALAGGGTMVDRLVKLVTKKGTATLDGTKFTSTQLMRKFVGSIIAMACEKYNQDKIDSLIFTVHVLSPVLSDTLTKAAESCGVQRGRIHVYTHTEAAIYYIYSQDPDIVSNIVSVFDLRDDGLYYYEMKALRGRKPVIIEAISEKLSEGFSLGLLTSDSGKKLGDTIMTSCAERMLGGKNISAVCLMGKGFAQVDWCNSFIRYICNKRRVFQVSSLFADGAAIAARDLIYPDTATPYLLSCEGRISSTVSMYTIFKGRREQIILAQAGMNWYEAKTVVEFILDDVTNIELSVTPAASTRVEKINIDVSDLPKRPNKTTRVEMSVSFTSETRMTVRIKDKGFGELFPASDMVIRNDYIIP